MASLGSAGRGEGGKEGARALHIPVSLADGCSSLARVSERTVSPQQQPQGDTAPQEGTAASGPLSLSSPWTFSVVTGGKPAGGTAEQPEPVEEPWRAHLKGRARAKPRARTMKANEYKALRSSC